jgi:hypothetical protein
MHTITILVFAASVIIAYWVGTLHGHARCGRKFQKKAVEEFRKRTIQKTAA